LIFVDNDRDEDRDDDGRRTKIGAKMDCRARALTRRLKARVTLAVGAKKMKAILKGLYYLVGALIALPCGIALGAVVPETIVYEVWYPRRSPGYHYWNPDVTHIAMPMAFVAGVLLFLHLRRKQKLGFWITCALIGTLVGALYAIWCHISGAGTPNMDGMF